jgi:hypothetical protein
MNGFSRADLGTEVTGDTQGLVDLSLVAGRAQDGRTADAKAEATAVAALVVDPIGQAAPLAGLGEEHAGPPGNDERRRVSLQALLEDATELAGVVGVHDKDTLQAQGTADVLDGNVVERLTVGAAR